MTETTPSPTSAVELFQYGESTVRTVMVNGEPWFVARDICNVLGLPNLSMATGRLGEDERGVNRIDTPGGPQEMAIVSESGMYSLVLRSDKPEAVGFRRWVTGTVLPTLRKTGTYSVASPAAEPVAALPDRKALARMVIEAEEAREAAEARVTELEPKADLADTFLIADGGARLVREVAKLLKMRERDLRQFLLDEKLVFAKHSPCGSVQYDFYAKYAHHFKAVEHIVNHTWGSCTHYTLMILPRGIELIEKRRREFAAASTVLPVAAAPAAITSPDVPSLETIFRPTT